MASTENTKSRQHVPALTVVALAGGAYAHGAWKIALEATPQGAEKAACRDARRLACDITDARFGQA